MADPASMVGFVAFALNVVKTAADFIEEAKDLPDKFKLSFGTNEFVLLVQRLPPALEKFRERDENDNDNGGRLTSIIYILPIDNA